MSEVEIVTIDKKVILKQTSAHLKRLAFEEAAPYLRLVLNDGALVHEGSDHIAVHLVKRKDRVLFARRANKWEGRKVLTTLKGLRTRFLLLLQRF